MEKDFASGGKWENKASGERQKQERGRGRENTRERKDKREEKKKSEEEPGGEIRKETRMKVLRERKGKAKPMGKTGSAS